MSFTDWQSGAEDVMASRNLVELGLAEFFQKLENSLVLSAKMYSSSLKVYLLDLKQGERIACLCLQYTGLYLESETVISGMGFLVTIEEF